MTKGPITMATETRLLDDLDGSADQVATYGFALEGITYEIDLNPDNLARMRSALDPFINAGRRTTTSSAGHRAKQGRKTPTGPANAVIRAWWTTNWQQASLPEPNSHGRIPALVADAYHRAH
jgi:hypothetical protein